MNVREDGLAIRGKIWECRKMLKGKLLDERMVKGWGFL